MKITVQKPVGILGEVWLVEVPVSNDILKSKDPVAGIESMTDVATRVLDNRLLQLNLRLIEHNKLAQNLPGDAAMAVRQCVEVMYGQMLGPSQVKPQVTSPDGEGQRDEKVALALERALEAVDEGGR